VSGAVATITPAAAEVLIGEESLATFDYSDLPSGIAGELKTTADTIRRLKRQVGADIVAIGINLIAVKDRLKDRLGHGWFGEWLEAEFSWSPRTARRFMLVAEHFAGKTDSVSVLEPTTLYLLTSPSTPMSIRTQVTERLDRGEPTSDRMVRNLVKKAKDQERAREQEERRLAAEAALSPSARKRRRSRREEIERFNAAAKAACERQDAALDDLARLLRSRFKDDFDAFIHLCKAVADESYLDLYSFIDRLAANQEDDKQRGSETKRKAAVELWSASMETSSAGAAELRSSAAERRDNGEALKRDANDAALGAHPCRIGRSEPKIIMPDIPPLLDRRQNRIAAESRRLAPPAERAAQ
jgi:hypothetical protein